jgi:hypothetical protein
VANDCGDTAVSQPLATAHRRSIQVHSKLHTSRSPRVLSVAAPPQNSGICDTQQPSREGEELVGRTAWMKRRVGGGGPGSGSAVLGGVDPLL